jgi:hypothetical protein
MPTFKSVLLSRFPVRRQTALVTAVASAALLLPASPAHAEVQKSGSQSCGVGLYVRLTAKGQGTLSFYLPNGVFRHSEYHSTIYPGSWTSTSRSGTWTITSDDILVDSGTFASCVPGAANAGELR